ncbi:hypothetical protein BH09BAC5_BH09BAC5_08840 [soil metagenome]
MEKIISLINTSLLPSDIRELLLNKVKQKGVRIEERQTPYINVYRLYSIRASALKKRGDEYYKLYDLLIRNLDNLKNKDFIISCSVHLAENDKQPSVFFVDADKTKLLGVV